MPTRTTKATLLGACAILFWGVTLPTSKYVAVEFGQFTTVGLCLLFGGLILRLLFGKPSPVPSKRLFSLRLVLNFLYFLCLHTAISQTSPEALPIIILANYLWPIATIVCSKVFVHSRMSARLYISFALVILALIIEKGGSELLNTPKPDLIWFLLAVSAAIIWGAYSALNKILTTQWGNVTHLSVLALSSGILLTLIGIIRQEPQDFASGSLIAFACYTFCTIAGQYLWDFGTRNGNIIILGFIADLTPWISLITAGIIFNTSLSATVYCAALLILMAAWIARRE